MAATSRSCASASRSVRVMSTLLVVLCLCQQGRCLAGVEATGARTPSGSRDGGRPSENRSLRRVAGTLVAGIGGCATRASGTANRWPPRDRSRSGGVLSGCGEAGPESAGDRLVDFVRAEPCGCGGSGEVGNDVVLVEVAGADELAEGEGGAVERVVPDSVGAAPDGVDLVGECCAGPGVEVLRCWAWRDRRPG